MRNVKKPNDWPQRCPCCNQEINESFLAHNLSPTHVFNYYMWSFQNKRKGLVKDKEGIGLRLTPISLNKIGLNMEFKKNKGKYSVQLDLHDLKAIENTLKFRCDVLNDRKEQSIFLTAACILDAHPWASCFDDKNEWMQSKKFVKIKPKQKYDGIVIQFRAENVVAGCFRIPFAVNLRTETGEKFVTFSRSLRVIIVDRKVEEPVIEDKQKSPFTDLQWTDEIKWLIAPHRRLPQLKSFEIPNQYVKQFENNLRIWKGMKVKDEETLQLLKDQMEPGHVTRENYKAFFHNCLWLEEHTNALMLNKYNMENVNMKVFGQADLRLQVPGLAEKRPSLIPGDMITIRVHDDHTGYEGYIRTVENNHVIIHLVDEELLQTVDEEPNILLDVAFKLGRLPYERAHAGINRICLNGMLKSLFPDQLTPHCYSGASIRDDEFENKTICQNLEQRTAVEKIVNRSSGLAPYIVFGPPGTGKTVTIVEAIVQILKRTTKKILICAPANAACDMLASKLIPYCSKEQLMRVQSESRDSSTIPREVLAYSNATSSGVFMKVGPKQLNRYRIVVSTLILIGKFGGTDDYRPDILFVDEAAQALETDVCVPLGVMQYDGQIVLAGDPKQLGPIVQSTRAQEFNLNKSLLERLMDTQKVYKDHANPNYITMLRKNFRSHPTILEIPNNLFYDSKLDAIAERPIKDPIAKYSIYPLILTRNNIKQKINGFVPGDAVEFCAISAKEQKEGRSPSYFNPSEANMIMQYIETLINMKLDPENAVKQSDIGVITPYIRQVYKIKGLLDARNLKDVEVGSTEAFQGREKRVIIISTVRAQNDLLQHDTKYSLGFVKQEKRFNVAITRAISKLVVVGCPAVLSTDEKWASYMDQCRELNTYFGAPYVERTDENMTEMVERFKNFPAFSSPQK